MTCCFDPSEWLTVSCSSTTLLTTSVHQRHPSCYHCHTHTHTKQDDLGMISAKTNELLIAFGKITRQSYSKSGRHIHILAILLLRRLELNIQLNCYSFQLITSTGFTVTDTMADCNFKLILGYMMVN